MHACKYLVSQGFTWHPFNLFPLPVKIGRERAQTAATPTHVYGDLSGFVVFMSVKMVGPAKSHSDFCTIYQAIQAVLKILLGGLAPRHWAERFTM